jgi:hypothetical protein
MTRRCQDDDYDMIPWGIADGLTVWPLGGRTEICSTSGTMLGLEIQVSPSPVLRGTAPLALSVVC